jgi:hypothetical protein
MTSLRSKWAVGKAVRAGLALEGASRTISRSSWFSPAGIKMVRDVTDEQRGRRPIFNATLRRHHHYMRDGALADTRPLTSQWHVFLLATSRIGRKVKNRQFFGCFGGERRRENFCSQLFRFWLRLVF